ncbi:unnamed protein product [Ixodes pacificus]
MRALSPCAVINLEPVESSPSGRGFRSPGAATLMHALKHALVEVDCLLKQSTKTLAPTDPWQSCEARRASRRGFPRCLFRRSLI